MAVYFMDFINNCIHSVYILFVDSLVSGKKSQKFFENIEV